MQKRPGKSPAVRNQNYVALRAGSYFAAVGNGTGLSESVRR